MVPIHPLASASGVLGTGLVRINDVESENTDLKIEIAYLNNKVENLEYTKDLLDSDVYNLNLDNKGLERVVNDLKIENSELDTKLSNCETLFDLVATLVIQDKITIEEVRTTLPLSVAEKIEERVSVLPSIGDSVTDEITVFSPL